MKRKFGNLKLLKKCYNFRIGRSTTTNRLRSEAHNQLKEDSTVKIGNWGLIVIAY